MHTCERPKAKRFGGTLPLFLFIFTLIEQTYNILYILLVEHHSCCPHCFPLGRGPPLGCRAEIRTRACRTSCLATIITKTKRVYCLLDASYQFAKKFGLYLHCLALSFAVLCFSSLSFIVLHVLAAYFVLSSIFLYCLY